MNAYDNQLQAAIRHLADANPMFDFTAAGDDARSRQLKTWWGKPLAEDARHGHDTSGPITTNGDLTDRQAVLLSFLQRPLRAERAGEWTVTAEPADGESLQLTVTGYGLTLSALIQETGGSVTSTAVTSSAETGDPGLPARMLYRSTYLEAPAADLVDALAFSAAFAESRFAPLAKDIRRTGIDTLEVLDLDVDLDWPLLEALLDGDSSQVAAAVSLDHDQTQQELSDVLGRAIELGYARPATRTIATPPPLPEPGAAGGAGGGTVLPEGHPARSILEDLGIDLSNTQVVGVGPGSSYGIGIGVDANGDLSVTDLPGLAVPAAPADPEEELAVAVADMLGISRDQLQDILDKD